MPGADGADARAEPDASASLSLLGSGSGSASGSSPTLLFSLQVFVGDVRLTAGLRPPDALLLGFQLLQFEIVLFERRELLGGARMAVEHGKACLFEAEPRALAAQLRDEAAAPLVVLLMAQERDRARLVAFASLPLPLHVGLAVDDALPADMRHRVCEWARDSGCWELRNHQGDVVGSATGAVTLSCLGKTLAPHLRAALGVQVDCAPSASPVGQSPSESSCRGGRDSVSKRQQQGGDEAGVGQGGGLEEGESDTPKEARAKADAAVQCDDESIASDAGAGQRRSPEAVCLVRAGRERHRGGGEARQFASGGNAGRGGSTPGRRGSPRCGAHDEIVGRATHRPAPAAAGGVISPRSLPPPLFFQKQPAGRRR